MTSSILKKYYLVFDTETTGLLPSNPHLVSIAYKVFVTETIAGETKIAMIHSAYFIAKVPLDVEIPDESAAIHKITTERSQNYGIDISTIIDRLHEVFQMWPISMIVAHNTKFDINVLVLELKRLRNKTSTLLLSHLQNIDLFCTCMSGKQVTKIERVRGRQVYYKLPKLVELHEYYFGNDTFTQHNAEGDTFACARCFFKMQYNKDINYEMSF